MQEQGDLAGNTAGLDGEIVAHADALAISIRSTSSATPICLCKMQFRINDRKFSGKNGCSRVLPVSQEEGNIGQFPGFAAGAEAQSFAPTIVDSQPILPDRTHVGLPDSALKAFGIGCAHANIT